MAAQVYLHAQTAVIEQDLKDLLAKYEVPDGLASPKALAAQLWLLRRSMGDPSYRDIARRARPAGLSPATISRLLQPSRELPAWRTVEAFLRGVGVEPTEIEDAWLPRWIMVANQAGQLSVGGDDEAGGPKTGRDDSDGGRQPTRRFDVFECRECGAAVVNKARHFEWHARATARYEQTYAGST